MRVTTAEGSVIGEGGPVKVRSPSTGARLKPSDPISIRRLSPLALARGIRREVEAQVDRRFLWTPVAFGTGAAIYFGQPKEPTLWAALLPLAATLALTLTARLWGRHRGLVVFATLVAFAAAGFADGKLMTDGVAAPVMPVGSGVATLEGWVVDVASPSAGRPRLLIAPSYISTLDEKAWPARLRVTLRSGQAVAPGEGIRFRAILNPPPGPASPGNYDFGRDAWFDRVGGVGLALTEPTRADPGPAPLGLALEMKINALRWALACRLAEDLRALGFPDGAGLAAAVTTSHQDWLAPDATDDLRNSGLAHMLAIAGLHTAAVTGFVFLAIRLVVAAWPALALRVSGKRLAAIGGLICVGVYLALSGAHPPARRAAITAAVAFIAILLDRRAVSLHALALAALIILFLQPVAVVEPGFQMSFCATSALVALAEIRGRPPPLLNLPWFLAWPQRFKDWAVSMLAVSFIAGAATGPFAIQHFNRMANYGLFANLFADLLASMVLMPSLVLASLGEAIGFSLSALSLPLSVAGWSGQGVVMIAHLFATAPGASHSFSSAPPTALWLSFVGIIFASLWRGRLRWVAAPLALAVLIWPRPPAPAGWIAADGANAAVVVNGRAIVLKPTVRQFASQAWITHRGLIAPFDPDLETRLAFDCNRTLCLPRYGSRPALGAWWTKRAPKPEALQTLCRASEIIILKADVATPTVCNGVMILRTKDFDQGGAGEIYPSDDGGWRINWAAQTRGDPASVLPSDSGE